MSLAGELARWGCARHAAGFDAPARAAARALIQDWLGCALAGLATPVGRIFVDHARAAGPGPCTALGRGTAPAEAAAQLAAALSHIVEMDDVERTSVLHPGTVVIPAALAAAELAGAPRAAFLDAVIAGYEVMVRVGRAVGSQHYVHFHNTATCGPFGAATAAGLALGLDAERLTWALGNAGTLAAGLWQFNADGALTKPLHPARAAANGLLAAQLAAGGLSGAEHILEGERGFFAALAPAGDPARVVAGLGRDPLAVHGVSFKPHASCRHTHAAIDAALELHRRLRGRAPASVVVRVYRTAIEVCDRAAPHTPAQAKFSLQFCVASALVRGHAGLAAFEGAGLADPGVRELAQRVVLQEDGALSAAYPREWGAEVIVRADPAGPEQRAVRRHPLGDPEAPLGAAGHAAKFRELAAYAGLAQHTAPLLEWIERLGEPGRLDTRPLQAITIATR